MRHLTKYNVGCLKCMMESLRCVGRSPVARVHIDWSKVGSITGKTGPLRSLRQAQLDPDVESLAYPMSHYFEHSVAAVPGCQRVPVGTFPRNIASYEWVSPGENDGEAWRLLCRLTNSMYVYWTAWCDYTGFSCQGGFKAWAHADPATLVQYAMSDADYALYTVATLPLHEARHGVGQPATLVTVPVTIVHRKRSEARTLRYDPVNHQVTEGDGVCIVTADNTEMTLEDYVAAAMRVREAAADV